MTYFDELSGQEACALLGIPSGTFKARLFRARREVLDQAPLAPIHKTTASYGRILKNVDHFRGCGDLNP
jgi:Sigma-70, region 4